MNNIRRAGIHRRRQHGCGVDRGPDQTRSAGQSSGGCGPRARNSSTVLVKEFGGPDRRGQPRRGRGGPRWSCWRSNRSRCARWRSASPPHLTQTPPLPDLDRCGHSPCRALAVVRRERFPWLRTMPNRPALNGFWRHRTVRAGERRRRQSRPGGDHHGRRQRHRVGRTRIADGHRHRTFRQRGPRISSCSWRPSKPLPTSAGCPATSRIGSPWRRRSAPLKWRVIRASRWPPCGSR